MQLFPLANSFAAWSFVLTAFNAATGQSVVFEPKHLEDIRQATQDGILSIEEQADLRAKGVSEVTLHDLNEMLLDRERFRGVANRSRVGLPLPNPISSDEFEMFIKLLELSESQHLYVAEEYKKYRLAARKAWMRTSPILNEAGDLAALDFRSDEFVVRIEGLMKVCESEKPRLAAVDNSFFDALSPVLADEQLLSLERCRMMRRRICSFPERNQYPAASIDLLRLYMELQKADQNAPPLTNPGVSEIFEEYEPLLTALMVEMRERANRAAHRSRRLMAERAAGRGDDLEAAIKYSQQIRSANRPVVGIAKRIHDLNTATLDRFSAVSPKSCFERMRSKFYSMAYPVIFPFETRPIEYCQALALRDDTPDELHDLFQSLYEMLIRDVDRVNVEMVRQYRQWREIVAERHGFQHDEYRKYQRKMIDQLRQRSKVIRSILDVVAAALPDEQPMVEQLKSLLDAELAPKLDVNAGQGYGWPHPYGNFNPAVAERRPLKP